MYPAEPDDATATIGHLVAAVVVAIIGLAGCASTASPSVSPAGLVEVTEPAVTKPIVTEPTATARPSPTPHPTASPSPAPVPTPRPTPPFAFETSLLSSALDANLTRLDELGLEVSFLARTVDGHEVRSEGAGIGLIPASNQKLVTAVGALELLPSDFRLATEFRLAADGTLYVIGGGDPFVGDDVLDELSAALAAAGVEVLDDVVVDPTRHVDDRTAPGWLDRNMPWDIGPMSAFYLDRNWFTIEAAYVADPDRGNAAELIRRLRLLGIDTRGPGGVGGVPAGTPLVLRHESAPLPELVVTMLRWSDNVLAESLLREIGLRAPAAVGDTRSGSLAVASHLEIHGLELELLGDGSGLSRANRLSAEQIVALLEWARGRSWWAALEEGLAPAAGEGTLAARLDTATTVGNVRAKTGTLDDARALSGTVRTVDDVELTFALLVNGAAVIDAVDAMDQIVVVLASATVDQLQLGSG